MEAQETRTIETCTRCGMIANLDPATHTQRYGHTPTVRREDGLYRFSFKTYSFHKVVQN